MKCWVNSWFYCLFLFSKFLIILYRNYFEKGWESLTGGPEVFFKGRRSRGNEKGTVRRNSKTELHGSVSSLSLAGTLFEEMVRAIFFARYSSREILFPLEACRIYKRQEWTSSRISVKKTWPTKDVYNNNFSPTPVPNFDNFISKYTHRLGFSERYKKASRCFFLSDTKVCK